MSERTWRMTASAVIVLAGAVAFGLGDLAGAAHPPYSGGGQPVGAILIVIGGVFFAVDWVTSWLDDRRARRPVRPGFPIVPLSPGDVPAAGAHAAHPPPAAGARQSGGADRAAP